MAANFCSFFLIDYSSDSREQGVLDELDESFEHSRFARKVSVQGGLRNADLSSEGGSRNSLAWGCF